MYCYGKMAKNLSEKVRLQISMYSVILFLIYTYVCVYMYEMSTYYIIWYALILQGEKNIHQMLIVITYLGFRIM